MCNYDDIHVKFSNEYGLNLGPITNSRIWSNLFRIRLKIFSTIVFPIKATHIVVNKLRGKNNLNESVSKTRLVDCLDVSH